MINNCSFQDASAEDACLKLQKYTKIPNACNIHPYYLINKVKN